MDHFSYSTLQEDIFNIVYQYLFKLFIYFRRQKNESEIRSTL